MRGEDLMKYVGGEAGVVLGGGVAVVLFYVMVPKTGLWRQMEGPYSSYCAFVWHTL